MPARMRWAEECMRRGDTVELLALEYLVEGAKEIENLRQVIRNLLATSLAEECQECGIGHTEPWQRAKEVLA